MQRVSGVYTITCMPTGEVYVGASAHVWARVSHHLAMLRLGKHRSGRLQAAWQRFGESAFEMRLVERGDNPKVLAAAEAAWMEKLGARQVGVGFNAGPAGTGLWYAIPGLAVPGQLEVARDAPSPDGSLALKLINTEVMERGKRRDLLTSPDALARWWQTPASSTLMSASSREQVSW